MNVADSESSLPGSRKVLLPPVTSDSTGTSNLLKGNNLANNSIRDSEQAEPENLDANRTAPREFGTFFIPLSPSQMDLESFYPESSMMELDWLFGVSNGQDIPPFNSSSPQWNSSQISAPNYHQPMAKHRPTVQASLPAILEPMRVEKPSPMSSHLSNTPSWPTDYLSNVDDSDHNQLMAAASPQDQAQRYEHEQTLARSTQSRCSYFPQELGRIAIEGRIDELPKYLDDDCRRVISVAFWEKWISRNSTEGFDVLLEGVEPSGFIDHTLSYFFKHFNRVYPLVHRASFSRTSTTPFLLFAMSAAGALYSNITGARAYSYDMANTLMGCLPKSLEFDHYMSIRLSTHQAVMILHILGYGSGDKTAIFKVRCGSGVATNIFHRSNAFNSSGLEIPSCNTSFQDTELLWRRWIEMEIKRRVGIIFMSKLAVISPLLSQPSLVFFSNHSVKFPSPSALWEAGTPGEWTALRRELHHPFEAYGVNDVLRLTLVTGSVLPSTSLTSDDFYVILCGLQEEIWKIRRPNDSSMETLNTMFFPDGQHSALEITEQKRTMDALHKWKTQFSKLPQTSSDFEKSFRCRTLVLWHSSMMRLHVDMESIQQAAGKNTTATHTMEMQQRIAGPNSQKGLRCAVWHAAQIYNTVEQFPLPREALDLGMLIGMLQAVLVKWWFSKQLVLGKNENLAGAKDAPAAELTEILEGSTGFVDFIDGNFSTPSVGGILLGENFRFLRNFWVKRLQESYFALGAAMADVANSLET
ncbi:hypothetical protein V8E51_003893 [Hyaloscypha variabilis]